MSSKMDIDLDLFRKLDVLRDQPARDSEDARRGRAAFLAEAQELAKSAQPGGSRVQRGTTSSWLDVIGKYFQPSRTAQRPTFSGILAVSLLLVVFFFGGSGILVAAAQSSQPDQVLYGVKILSEDVRAALTSNETDRIRLALELVDRRATEMVAILSAGEAPPVNVQSRMAAEIDLALRLAAAQDNDKAVLALVQIQGQLQEQEQRFLQLTTNGSPEANAALSQVQMMLQERLRLCEDGLADPQRLRERLKNSTQPEPSPTAILTNSPSITSATTVENGNGLGNGNQHLTRTTTPASKNGYRPDPKDGYNYGTQAPTAENRVGTPTPCGSIFSASQTPGGGNGGGNPTPDGDGNGDNNPTPDGGGNGGENGGGGNNGGGK